MPGRPTSFDIAARAGVSQPTVSRALSGSRVVREATRLRVEAAARELGYTVDRNASALRRGSSKTLALLFFEDPTADGSLINPFFLSMLGSLVRAAARRGYDLLTSFQQLSSDWHVAYEDSHKADGLILLGYGDFAVYRARVDQLVAQGTHFVRWGSARAGEPGTTLGCDNLAGGRAAGRHLAGRGRRRVAFLGDASDRYPEFADRYRGLCAALQEAGLAADPALVVPALSTERAGHAAAVELIGRGHFDAVFAASDLIAVGALRALAEAGRSVPGDVAVVGFDDIPAAGLATPALTTVAQDAEAAGAALVDALLRQIGGEPTASVALPARLVVRASA